VRLLHPTTEDEMIALFLRTEITSQRFDAEIVALLERGSIDRRIIENPDTANTEENRIRCRLLGDFRGYGQNRALFEDFPETVEWHWVALNRDEVARIRYINYSYWNELSGGSRLPKDAALAIRAGREIYRQSNAGFLKMAEALRNGAELPPLILVGASLNSEWTVLEGHARLTAYALEPDCIPEPMEVLIGFAPEFAAW